SYLCLSVCAKGSRRVAAAAGCGASLASPMPNVAAKARPDPKNFRFVDKKSEHLAKLPGEIGGLDFLVDGCEDCDIFLLDNTSQVFVDYCKRCSITIGPVSGSVFFRNCEGCQIKVACGQMRTRDCLDCNILVLVPGRPTIEASRGMRFGPLLTAYEGFEGQMQGNEKIFYAYAVFPDPKVEASGLARRFEEGGEACHWRNVYDFSSNDPACGNWSALSRREAQAVLASFPAAPVGEAGRRDLPRARAPLARPKSGLSPHRRRIC
ncbi:unnamed protein product, partial [Prorocentrum cordatum]